VTNALLALLIVTLALLGWRAVTRDRRDYARFKRLRSTRLRRRVFRRWVAESWLVLGGLAAALLLAGAPYVGPALEDARGRGPLAFIPWESDLVTGLLVGAGVGTVMFLVVPVLLLRGKLEEIPAVGDIRALLPRNRGELPYGAALGVTAGVVEELLFRLAMPAVAFGITGDGLLAFGVSALVFGLLHVYQGWQGMLLSVLLGLLFTVLYVLSGSIAVPIAAHALIDLRSLVLIPVVLGGAWHRAPTPPARGTAPPAPASPTR